MGMDVYGKQPSADAGRYFRASIWAWRPIHELVCLLCSDLLSEELLKGIGFNGGSGPDDSETCLEMADRFTLWLEGCEGGHMVESEQLRVTETGRLVSERELKDRPEMETRSPFYVPRESLDRWVEFLQHCGGFAVY